MVESGLVRNGFSRMTLPFGEVRRKWDQPNHSRVTSPACAEAGVAAGRTAITSTAASAAPRTDTAVRARCPSRRGILILEPSTPGLWSAPSSAGHVGDAGIGGGE